MAHHISFPKKTKPSAKVAGELSLYRLFQKWLPIGPMFRGDQLINRRAVSLNDDHVRIAMNRMNSRLERRRGRDLPTSRILAAGDLFSVQVARQSINVKQKWIGGTLDIFTDINAARTKVGQRFFQGGDLLGGRMTTVVDDDVESGDVPADLRPEASIGLIAYEDANAFAFIRFAGGLDVYTIDIRPRAEVVLPHAETAAAKNADFQDVRLAVTKLGEMTVINFEIVTPFPDAWAACVGVEV